MITPVQLRCEYHVNPFGIDAREPRLFWKLQGEGRGRLQSAYHVLVASDPERLARDEGDLWDSGRVLSDAFSQIAYAGKPLASRAACWWKVRAWDERGAEGPWSEPAHWTMGLLDPAADWQAQWIGGLAPVPLMRKPFETARPVRRAMLYVTALGAYELELNGARVGNDYFVPGWTDYPQRLHYLTYDVTALLRAGANVIGAAVAPGWYCGFIGWEGRNNFYGNEPALRLQLELELEGGERQVIATDGSWTTAEGPLRMGELLHGEEYDARRELPGWSTPEFDPAAHPAQPWLPVEVLTPEALASSAGAPVAAPTAHPGNPVRRTQEVPTQKITQPQPGVWIFDLGQNMVGGIRLKTKGPRGKRLVIRYAEMLNPDGSFYVSNLRRAQAIDHYYLKGEGEEVFEPRFTFHGFRYVEVHGLDFKDETPPTPEVVTGIVMHSDVPPTGAFECSDARVNRLYQNIDWGRRGNYFEIPTDCPQRDERLGWTGDAQVFIRTAAYQSEVAAFFTKWLADMRDAQRPDGSITDIVPMLPNVAIPGSGNAGWADAAVICPWIVYQMYGDRRVLEACYPMMRRHVAFYEAGSKDGIREDKGYLDWLNIDSPTPGDIIGTAFYGHAVDLTARAARVLGRGEEAAALERQFAQIREAFTHRFVDAQGKTTRDTQTSYLLALNFDLLPEALRPLAMARLAEAIERNKGRLNTGFLGVNLLNPTLTRFGRVDLAYQMLTNDEFPSWLYEVKHGATTIWERWDGWTEQGGFQNVGMNSFNHYAYGSVGEWLFDTVAGIESDGPAFRRVRIRPRLGGGLTHARAHYDSLHGRIASAWKLEGGKLTMEVSVPAGVTATVHVPTSRPESILEGGQSATSQPGVRLLAVQGHPGVFVVGSGDYVFEADWQPA